MSTPALPVESMTVVEKLLAMEALLDAHCRNEEQIPIQEWHKQVPDERQRQIEACEATFTDFWFKNKTSCFVISFWYQDGTR